MGDHLFKVGGAHVSRLEDMRLITGAGTYASDWNLPAGHPTASRVNPLGIKGMGESGCTASLGALVNAVVDALRPLGIQHLDMPLTPSRVWTAIVAARTKQ
jgi:carbon-monoxide dehydrogenase large subunit